MHPHRLPFALFGAILLIRLSRQRAILDPAMLAVPHRHFRLANDAERRFGDSIVLLPSAVVAVSEGRLRAQGGAEAPSAPIRSRAFRKGQTAPVAVFFGDRVLPLALFPCRPFRPEKPKPLLHKGVCLAVSSFPSMAAHDEANSQTGPRGRLIFERAGAPTSEHIHHLIDDVLSSIARQQGLWLTFTLAFLGAPLFVESQRTLYPAEILQGFPVEDDVHAITRRSHRRVSATKHAASEAIASSGRSAAWPVSSRSAPARHRRGRGSPICGEV